MSDIPESQQTKVKGIVDIVFLMDATGSMKPCIDAVKDNLRMFIGELTGGANNQATVQEWRAKVVAYRDFIYDNEPLVDHDFTDDPGVLESQLGALEAVGGGDEPESLLEGLYHAANMGQTERGEPLSPNKWRYRGDGARVVIIFTDASFHEVMEKPEGGTFDDVVNACHTNRIIMQVYAPEMDCYDMLAEIDKADVHTFSYDKSKDDGAVQALREFTSDKKNFQETLRALAKTVTQSAQPELL